MTKSRGIRPRITEKEFWSRIIIGDEDACWIWTGCRLRQGYGVVSWKGAAIKAHRLAYQLHHNLELPKVKKISSDAVVVMHTCDNPPCCNPRHLILGTVADNNADRDKKGRWRPMIGERNGMFGRSELAATGDRHGSKTKPDRVLRGSAIGNSKLSDSDIPLIREMLSDGKPQGEIAKIFGISREAICRISCGRTWRHIPDVRQAS